MEFQTFLVVSSIATISAVAETALKHFGKDHTANVIKVSTFVVCGAIILKMVGTIVLTAQTVMHTFSFF